ncbi:MAG: GDP-mannose 4,6-dehydratase [Candidatus Bathyarchaeia archaeon]
MVELRGARILVTGGAGFIGSHLVDKLLQRECKIIVYDNFDPFYTGKEDNIKHHFGKQDFQLIEGDILDFETLCSAMKGVDIVFHEAAQPGVGYSLENPYKTHMVNVTGTLNVLQAARKRGVKKVVYASSSSVYGIPEHLPMREEHPTKPLSIYGASKLAAEAYCRLFYERFGLDTVSLRYFTVYGERNRPDMAVFKFTKLIFEGKPPVIYGNGNQTRDFTYINDIVEGTLVAAEKDDIGGESINLGGGIQTTVNDLVNQLLRLIRKQDVIPIYDEPRPEDMPHTLADISKARRMLGYSPSTPLEEGLRRFVAWYKARKASSIA